MGRLKGSKNKKKVVQNHAKTAENSPKTTKNKKKRVIKSIGIVDENGVYSPLPKKMWKSLIAPDGTLIEKLPKVSWEGSEKNCKK